MSRSFKKVALVTASKCWNSFLEHAFRRRVKKALHTIETQFDPDADWEEAQMSNKKLRDYGTKFGFYVEPNPDDCMTKIKWYKKLRKK